MREKLLTFARSDPRTLDPVDADLRHLFQSWFNRGFLMLKPIDWNTPASILEKIIRYEAVHAIGNWDELRQRLAPVDRRCFAFFHPSIPDDPLIFVEVALTGNIPASIASVLDPDRVVIAPEDAQTAVFYSISNCHRGLAGVSFGSFLIKQVADDLKETIPNLKTFVTLSPAPAFARWLGDLAPERVEKLEPAERRAIEIVASPSGGGSGQGRRGKAGNPVARRALLSPGQAQRRETRRPRRASTSATAPSSTGSCISVTSRPAASPHTG